MKRVVVISIIICILLTGCSPLGASYRDLEELLLIKTLGIDAYSESRLVSAAGRINDAAAVTHIEASGATVSDAMSRMHGLSYEEELFFPHVSHLLIGEATARKGIAEYLSFICRSSYIRLGVPIYIIEGSTARDLIFDCGNDISSISEILAAVQADMERRGSEYFTAARVKYCLERTGSALVCAVSPEPVEDGMTAAFSGYAVVKDGSLRSFLSVEYEPAVGLLLGKLPISVITVRDMYGADTSVELSYGDTEFVPEYVDGKLDRLKIVSSVKASILEIGGSGRLSAEGYEAYLTQQLETELEGRMNAVIDISQTMNADFLVLEDKLELADAHNFSRISGDFGAIFPSLPVEISVSAVIEHSNDIGDQ